MSNLELISTPVVPSVERVEQPVPGRLRRGLLVAGAAIMTTVSAVTSGCSVTEGTQAHGIFAEETCPDVSDKVSTQVQQEFANSYDLDLKAFREKHPGKTPEVLKQRIATILAYKQDAAERLGVSIIPHQEVQTAYERLAETQTLPEAIAAINAFTTEFYGIRTRLAPKKKVDGYEVTPVTASTKDQLNVVKAGLRPIIQHFGLLPKELFAASKVEEILLFQGMKKHDSERDRDFHAGGLADHDNNRLYLGISDLKHDSDVFNHEFGHFWDEAFCKGEDKDPIFEKLNPPGFKYNRAARYSDYKLTEPQEEGTNERYSVTNNGEDKANVSKLFTTGRWSQEPVVRQKEVEIAGRLETLVPGSARYLIYTRELPGVK